MKPNRVEQEEIRLNRYLALSGVGSRRTCDDYIAQGRIEVNGEVITSMGSRISPENDIVKFDGRIVRPTENFIYLLLNKPLYTVSTVRDEKGRKTVIDLINLPIRLFPVGRLDFNTTGVLLITNDGEFSYFLTHPSFEIRKVYRALINKLVRPIDLHYLQRGVELDGKITAPCKIQKLRVIDNCSYLEIELHEGRNRQIKRMFQALDYQVEELERVNFAGLEVGDLKKGEWRELTIEEVSRLNRLIDQQKSKIFDKVTE
jgi:pseudouridine synthase